MKTALRVTIGKLTFPNPVMAASGTFGVGEEYGAFFRIGSLGAIVTKTITLKPRIGNPPDRVVETSSGMLNSIGLENKGLRGFLESSLPFLKKLTVPVIVSIAGESAREFAELTRSLDDVRRVAAVELNLSCPNVGHTTRMMAQDEKAAFSVVRAAKQSARRIGVIAKLSPKVTDIGAIAYAAERAGADAVSLINTVPGVAIDIHSKRSRLGMPSGGLSGPAIKPIALEAVREARRAVDIPIIGVGGIMTAEDAIEFILCGASAVQVGTASFVNPKAALEVLEGIKKYAAKQNVRNISELVGAAWD
ncbi:MAG: dihydroorotate dehydrogenase [Candidatus Omnitrophota bacterium]